MKIQTEPIGSIPRPKFLVDALNTFSQHKSIKLNYQNCMTKR